MMEKKRYTQTRCILLLICDILFLVTGQYLHASEPETKDSLFQCYRPVYPAFVSLVDSLADNCPDSSAYSISFSRHSSESYSHILIQRYDGTDKQHIITSDCFGVFSFKGTMMYLSGIKDYDLIEKTDIHVSAKAWPYNPDCLYDGHMSMYLFDKMHLCRLNRDFSVTPVGDTYLSNRDPYYVYDSEGRLHYVTSYEPTDDGIRVLVKYHTTDGEDILAQRLPDIKFRKRPAVVGRYIDRHYSNRYITVTTLLYVDPESGQYEIRSSDPYSPAELQRIFIGLVIKNKEQIIKDIEMETPYVVQIWWDIFR